MSYSLYIITGAPGSGKTTALEAFLCLHSSYLAFDIDWLAGAVSELAGKNIFSDPTTWKPYAHLWFEILHAICKNGVTPVFFTPNAPQDFEIFGRPDWCDTFHWLLLDCPDSTRRERLSARRQWTEPMTREALDDAAHLRRIIPRQLDTAHLNPAEVATEILLWLDRLNSSSE